MLNRQSASGGGRNRDEARARSKTRRKGRGTKGQLARPAPGGFKATDFTVAMLFSRHFLIALSPQKRRSNASCAEITRAEPKERQTKRTERALSASARRGHRGREREREREGGKERRKESVKEGREEASRDRNRFAIASVYRQTPTSVYSLCIPSLSNYSPARH